MIKDIKEINFPEYATLSQATVNIADMGERSITTQIKIDGDIVPDFSYDWEVEYKGERYVHAARTPQASKDNTSRRTRVDLTFKHWAISELQRYYFFETASTEAGTVVPDKYKSSLGLSLPNFVNAFNKVLDYYFNGDIRMVLNPTWESLSEPSFVEINYSHLWDVLQKVYEIYGIRWSLEPVTGELHKYLIKLGYDAVEASHIFEYGYKGGLLKVERQVQSTEIKNIILGRGGNKNLPFLYFKDYDKYGAGSSESEPETPEDTSGSSETKTIDGVIAPKISSLGKNQKTSVKATYSGTFEVPEKQSGVLFPGVVDAKGQYRIVDILYYFTRDSRYIVYKDVEVVYISLGSPFIRVFNNETKEEVSPVAIPAGKYYYTWENEVTNNYTDTIYNVEVSLPSLTLITGDGAGFDPTLIGNRGFRPDPDAIPELKDVPFTELRSIEFREYVQGWKAAHYDGVVPAEPSEAFIKGLTDKKFNPIEYVKDDDSIAKYGEQWGALENNEEIYPSIQNSGVDDVIAVEEMTNDYMTDEEAENDSVTTNLNGAEMFLGGIHKSETRTETMENIASFSVPDGKNANVLRVGILELEAYVRKRNSFAKILRTGEAYSFEGIEIGLNTSDDYIVHDANGKEYSKSGLGPGTYYIDWSFTIESNYSGTLFKCTASIAGFKLTTTTVKESKGPTFDIWVKNLWNTTRGANETTEQYAQRVWIPILGTDGTEAQVTFTTGLLSVSSDYQFTIAKIPELDESKTYNGEQSHWRISLYRSEAEYESTGKLLPNTQINAKAGDKFFFTGIELPHQYVVWAETRLSDYKKDSLITNSNIQPNWVVSVDKIRANSLESGEVVKLIDQLAVGSKIRIANKQLIDGDHLEVYVKSATYTWSEPSKDKPYIYPDVEIVLSDKVITVLNPVEEIKGDISTLQKQLVSLSEIKDILRSFGDRLYLRKDGIEDTSLSPTKFANLITGSKFRQGSIGGTDWGFYRDANGRAVLEVDRAVIRDELSVNSLIINQAAYVGGMQINSAASVECSSVEETDDGYKCYFDRKKGAVANLFKVDDVAMCQQWDGDTTTQKFYKRRVTECGDNYIVLSKTDVYGIGIPAERDTIIHYGNYTDKQRQYVIIRDVIGGGYERMLEGLDSVTSNGKQYYYAGRQSGSNLLWFVGDEDNNQFAKYEAGKLIISGQFTVNSQFQNADGTYSPLQEYLDSFVVNSENINQYVDSIVKGYTDELQKQIDGAIETWFYEGIPTLSNVPANQWTTTEIKNVHLGDLYYDQNTGKCYRFQMDGDTYVWREITDTDIQAALDAASNAQDTADSKRRIFFSQPVPPYDAGDLWVNATYGTQYKNDILRCSTSRASGTFAIGDWQLASKYTDDTVANAAAKAAADAMQEAKDSKKSVNDLKSYVDGAFKDGIIDDSEAVAIEKYINTVNAQKAQADATYTTLYNNAYLTGGAKTGLFSAKSTLDNRTTSLIEAINNAIADGVATDEEKNAVDNAFDSYNAAYNSFASAIETANKAIQDYIKGIADEAHTAADNAKKAADSANNRLAEWASDNVISPTEKQGIKDEIARIDADKTLVTNGYLLYGLGEPTAYNAAYTAYREQLVALSAATPETITIPSTFAANQTAYYTQRTSALYAIDNAAKKKIDDVDREIAGYSYIKKALGSSTTVTGGLVLTSLIQLGTTVGSTFNVYSGINGVIDTTKRGNGIAAWYGGQMIDHEEDPSLSNWAKSLYRFDGSGYIAGGNISWNVDGSGFVGKDAFGNPVVSWDSTGVRLSNEIKLGTSSETLNSILAFMLKFNNMFEIETLSDGRKVIKAKLDGLYTNGFLSALGLNDDTGGGGSGASALSELVDVSLAGLSADNVLIYDGTHWVNRPMSTIRPDLTGYATQSWVTGQGYLTAAALNGYATQSWVQQQGYLTSASSLAWSNLTGKPTTLGGYGITDALGHVPLNGGLMVVNHETTWGNQTGTQIAEWRNNSDGGIKIRKDNPVGGTMSLLIDGTVYINEGLDAVASQSWADGRYVGKSTYTAADVLAKLKTVDGSGSGLDADLLDGKHLADILASNVASATRLQTPRTIWGQSFDGTRNISTSSAAKMRYCNFTGNDGSTSVGYVGIGSTIRETLVLMSYTSSVLIGANSGDTDFYITTSHLVGIGTTSPAYKLDVNGVIHSTTGFVIGGAMLVWDAENNAVKVVGKDGSTAVNFYAVGGVSALGISDLSIGGSGASALSELVDVSLAGLSADNVLIYDGTHWVNRPMSTIRPDLTGYATQSWVTGQGYLTAAALNGYATQSWVQQQGYLTSHQPLDHIDFLENKRDNLDPFGAWTYKGVQYSLKFNSVDGLVDGGLYHGVMTLHKWYDSSGGAVHQLGFTNNGNMCMRYGTESWSAWKRFAFVDDIPTSMAWSAITGKPTTLGGYGITDAYTKGEADGRYVSKSGDTMTGGLTINASGVLRRMLSDLDNYERGLTFISKEAGNRLATIGYYNTPKRLYLNPVGSDDVWYDAVGKYSLVIGNNYLAYNTYNIWHSGNDGSGSGLDADLLDGKHLTDILSSNVASATKLQTARTIWGQSFDGTRNISTSSVAKMRYCNFTGNDGSTSVGYVGIGSTIRETLVLMSYTSSVLIGANSGDTDFYITTSHLVGIGTTSPAYKLDVNGVIHSNTGIFSDGYVSALGQNTSSDVRLKNLIRPVRMTVEQIASAPSWIFNWKNGAGTAVGSIAQYWRNILPEAITTGHNGYLEMQYGNIALASVITVSRKVVNHEERIRTLEAENRDLKKQIEEFRKAA